MEHVEFCRVEPVEQVADGLGSGDGLASDDDQSLLVVWQVVGLPLVDVEILLLCVRIHGQFHTHVVEALQRAHARRAHRRGMASVGQELLKRLASDGDILRVHRVALYIFRLHGLERSRSHMERHFLAVDAVGINVGEHLLREVEPRRRCCHRTLYLRIDRLIGRLVRLLRLAVEVRRNGQFADGIQYLGKGDAVVVP